MEFETVQPTYGLGFYPQNTHVHTKHPWNHSENNASLPQLPCGHTLPAVLGVGGGQGYQGTRVTLISVWDVVKSMMWEGVQGAVEGLSSSLRQHHLPDQQASHPHGRTEHTGRKTWDEA